MASYPLQPLRSRRDYGEDEKSKNYYEDKDSEIKERIVLQKYSTCLDPLFRRIKRDLKKSEKSQLDISKILSALDKIYKKYRELEKKAKK